MKISNIFNKFSQKTKRITFIVILIISYITIVQFISVFVSTMTTIFMYLSSFSILLGFIIQNKLKKYYSKNMKVEKLDDKLQTNTISITLDRILNNETIWIEFYESQIHQYIRIKTKSSFYIIIKIFLFISLSIIVIFLIIMIILVSGETNLIIFNIISLLQYLFIIPLISTDLYINSGKTIYRYAKKSLNYIKKRNKLIYHNSKLRTSNYESFKIQINNINNRIDDFNKIFNPFSYYIRDFEIITIFGIFINIFLVVNFDYFLIPLLYISILYMIYIIDHVMTNNKIKKDKLYKQIESDLDLLTFL
ncbi:hypothetical protein LCGC14_1834980 [marine sediment metagenome]|uniref:Uncharacterized protein n=1 Tax=marine sediment metagenome TaxID=412755 RepID=A0A0F9GEY8_9ZZZZ